MKRFLVIMMLGLLCLALVGGCGKKQEEPAMEQQQTPADTTVTVDTTVTTTDTVSSTK